MKQRTTLVWTLLAINVLVYIASKSLHGIDTLALHFPKNDLFQPWQLITHMFMHGSPQHLLFNMFALWMFGSPLEILWGKKRFLIFYFLSGLGAALVYLGVHYYEFQTMSAQLIQAGLNEDALQAILREGRYPTHLNKELVTNFYSVFHTPMVGASGALYGVMVAFAYLFPNHSLMLLFLPVPIPAKYFVPGVVLLDLFSGLTGFSIFGGGIAYFAHVGGAVTGFLLMLLWKKKKKDDLFINQEFKTMEHVFNAEDYLEAIRLSHSIRSSNDPISATQLSRIYEILVLSNARTGNIDEAKLWIHKASETQAIENIRLELDI